MFAFTVRMPVKAARTAVGFCTEVKVDEQRGLAARFISIGAFFFVFCVCLFVQAARVSGWANRAMPGVFPFLFV